MKIQIYEKEQNIIETELWKKDELTFSVLTGIVNYGCEKVLTDHENFVICYSCPPYPVWIWVADGVHRDILEQVWNLTTEEFPSGQGYRYNMKYDTAEFFLEKSRETGDELGIEINMNTYACHKLAAPARETDGGLCRAAMDDLEELAQFSYLFRQEIGTDLADLEECRKKIRGMIETEGIWLWKNDAGETVAMCAYDVSGTLGKVTHVYTRQSARRRSYAQHVVYEVTRMIREQGLLPVLYADADYAASNACYQGIGYEVEGKLCTVGQQP